MKTTLRQSASAFACLCVVIALNFFLPRLMPGDPVMMLTGLNEDVVESQAQYDMYYEKLGLSKPMYMQFWQYLKSLVGGDFGYSYHYNASVRDMIAERLPNTLLIAVPSVFFSSVLALVFASLTGSRERMPVDSVITGFAIVLNAIPGFLLSLTLMFIFAYKLGWAPFSGLVSTIVPRGGTAEAMDRIKHMILPVTVLTLSSMPGKFLVLRNQIAAAAKEKYVMYAKARGISSARIQFVHVFRNVCQPFITMIGLNVGFILSGSVVVENIFSIKGMGQLMTKAITARDFPTMQGCLFVTSLAVIAADIVTRFICVLVDPKVRYGVYETE